MVLALVALSPELLATLTTLAAPVRATRRARPDLVRQTVLALCEGRFLGPRVLAALLGRRDMEGADLRKRILNPLVQEGLLLRAYPRPSDPRQAYIRAPRKPA